MKKVKQILSYVFLLLILSLTLTGCSNDKGNSKSSSTSEDLKSKVASEIDYLDAQLLAMLNKMNGISFRNYRVTSEKIEESQASESSAKSVGTSEDGQSSSESADSSGGKQGTNQSGASGGSGKSSNQNFVNYKMEPDNILSNQPSTDWETLKQDVEKLYSAWATMVLDFYKVNLPNDEILAFSSTLDLATQALEKQDKVASMNALADLYRFIPTYASRSSDDIERVKLFETKSYLLRAYALVEQDKTEEVKQELVNAEQAFLPIMNSVDEHPSQYNINKTYVLLKELQNSIDVKDRSIFYIKYKNVLEELEVIQA